MRYIFLTILLATLALPGLTQTNWVIAPEAGVVNMLGDVDEMDFIRGDIPYPGSYYISTVNSINNQWFIGAKAEKRLFEDKLGLAAGLRFLRAEYSIGPDNYWTNTGDFFYWEVERENNNTYYYKVKGIEQNNSYVGIPLEVRYFISNPYIFRLYAKIGVEFNLLLHSGTDILFKDEDMESHSSELTNMLEEPAHFVSSLYTVGGITLGKPDKPHGDIAIIFPYGYLNETGSIIKRGLGAGAQVSFIIPLKTTK